jgi:hypothetical protein
MFNVGHLYTILYSSLLKNNYNQGLTLKKFGICNNFDDIIPVPETTAFYLEQVYFYDQEPLGFSTKIAQSMYDVVRQQEQGRFDFHYNIWATSEYNNPLLDAFCEQNNLVKWYYFYHAFASLDWLRSVQFLPKVNIYEGATYISLNNLCEGPRVYRPLFVAKLYDKGLLGDGIVSYRTDGYKTNNFLNQDQRQLIDRIQGRNFRIQKTHYQSDNASAELEYDLWTSAFWHVVSETCYYEKTNHLTEKIFKPIASRQPFILLGSAGSLQYLKQYGFQTFSDFIDESYDLEQDPEKRMDMVVEQIKRLTSLTSSQLKSMYDRMLPILEHNFRHFYNTLYDVCWKELVDNYNKVTDFLDNNQKLYPRHDKITQLDSEYLSYKNTSGRLAKLISQKCVFPRD